MANPRKRRVRRARKAVAVRHNPIRARSRRRNPARRRRNPIGNEASKPMQLLTPALVGALGAAGVNTVVANIAPSLPAALTTGNMMYVTQIAAALGLAMLAPHAGSKKNMVLQAAEGSLTVTLHQAIVNLSGGFGMTLSGMGVYMPGRGAQAVPRASGGQARMAGMGAYLTGNGSPTAARAQAMRQAQAAPAKTMRGFNF